MTTPLQLNPPVLLRLAAGEQNGENDQDRDRADIDKDLHQADELRAEQEEKRRHADKRDDETERRMDELGSVAAASAPARVRMAMTIKAALFIRRNDRCAGQISSSYRAAAKVRDKQPRSQPSDQSQPAKPRA